MNADSVPQHFRNVGGASVLASRFPAPAPLPVLTTDEHRWTQIHLPQMSTKITIGFPLSASYVNLPHFGPVQGFNWSSESSGLKSIRLGAKATPVFINNHAVGKNRHGNRHLVGKIA